MNQREASKLRVEITDVSIEHLTKGDLIASGIAVPPEDAGSPRQDLGRDLWPVLDLRLRDGEAEGVGLRFVELQIRASPEFEARQSSSSETGGDPQPEEEVHHARRGPRTVMPLVEAEMIARARRGELQTTLAAESRLLELWVKKHHPHVDRPPLAETIQESLRSLYNSLKEQEQPGI